MSNLQKRIPAILITIGVIGLIVLGIIAAQISPNYNSDLDKYGAEAVRILEKYKDFDIDAKEAAKRLDVLIDKVYKIKNNPKNEDEEHNSLMLWLDLSGINMKLNHYGSATGYEIDEAIRNIKSRK